MYHRARMKQETKQLIRATRPRPIWITLLWILITGAGASLLENLVSLLGLGGSTGVMKIYLNGIMDGIDPDVLMANCITYLLSNRAALVGIIISTILILIVSSLWRFFMNAGYTGYTLDVVGGRQTGVKTLLCAFPKAGKVIATNVLVWVFTFLWTLLFVGLFVAVAAVATLLPEAAGLLLVLVGSVALFAAVMWVTLRYAMVNYLLMDLDMSGMEAIRTGKRMMKGNKWRLFVLQLSFIGWYLILFAIVYGGLFLMVLSGALAVGGASGGSMGVSIAGVLLMFVVLLVMAVGVMFFSAWLTPYVNCAHTRFYLFVKSQRTDLFPWERDTYSGDTYDTDATE